MTAKPDRNAWTPEMPPRYLRDIASVIDALNAAEEEHARGEVGLSFQGIVEVTIDDNSYMMGRTEGENTYHHQVMHMGIIQPVDAAAWVFTPGDPTDRSGQWGDWVWFPWPEDAVHAVIEAARAVDDPHADASHREALGAALEALDKSTYTLCARKRHIVRGDHTGKDGQACDHRYPDDRECGSPEDQAVSSPATALPG